MGLAGVFYLALYGFYRFHAKALRVQEVTLDVHEGSRLALDFIERELRFAGARPLADGPCAGFERLTVADRQQVVMQYDFRGSTTGTPPDGCPDDPNERIVYLYDATSHVLKRGTGGGPPQPFVNNIAPDGFLLRYFDRNGAEFIPALEATQRAAVQQIVVTVRTSKPHPDPSVSLAITSELSTTIFLPNPPR
jgi:hypothetical protein